MNLDQHIQLLAQSGNLSEVTVSDIYSVITTLQKWHVDINQEQVVMLIAHIAIAYLWHRLLTWCSHSKYC